MEILIIAVGLFFLYILSCFLVFMHRELKKLSRKLSLMYAIGLTILLSLILFLVWKVTYFDRSGSRREIEFILMLPKICDILHMHECNITAVNHTGVDLDKDGIEDTIKEACEFLKMKIEECLKKCSCPS